MSLPDEKQRAVSNTREFLFDLLDTKKTPNVPRSVREQARMLLKHYPYDGDLVVNQLKGSKKPDPYAEGGSHWRYPDGDRG
jgi:hypothetical protein